MAGQGFLVMDSDSPLAVPDLSFDTKRKVLWDNRARLYNLQPVSVESPGGN